MLDDMCAILAADGYYETLRGAFDSTNALASEDASTSEQGASAKDKWNENVGATIERDLARTFPNHEFFAARTSKGADGRNALANILKAYAIHDSKVGYCQGMAFVAGLLLIYLSESRAFAAFVTIMEGSDFRSMYLHGMEGLKVRLRQLAVVLRAKNPALAQHLEKHDVAPRALRIWLVYVGFCIGVSGAFQRTRHGLSAGATVSFAHHAYLRRVTERGRR